jgi:hypothetical protein
MRSAWSSAGTCGVVGSDRERRFLRRTHRGQPTRRDHGRCPAPRRARRRPPAQRFASVIVRRSPMLIPSSARVMDGAVPHSRVHAKAIAMRVIAGREKHQPVTGGRTDWHGPRLLDFIRRAIHFRPPAEAGNPARASDAVAPGATASERRRATLSPGHQAGPDVRSPVVRVTRQSASGERSG